MRAALLLTVVLSAGGAVAQSIPLADEIAKADRIMFEAFNRRDLDAYMAFFTEDVEFYHDKDGALVRAQVEAGFKRLFAMNNGLRRDLVEGTLEVHPIGSWGAIEAGAHRFCHDENGKQDCGTFRFVLVWQRTGGGWKVRRVLSYGH